MFSNNLGVSEGPYNVQTKKNIFLASQKTRTEFSFGAKKKKHSQNINLHKKFDQKNVLDFLKSKFSREKCILWSILLKMYSVGQRDTIFLSWLLTISTISPVLNIFRKRVGKLVAVYDFTISCSPGTTHNALKKSRLGTPLVATKHPKNTFAACFF